MSSLSPRLLLGGGLFHATNICCTCTKIIHPEIETAFKFDIDFNFGGRIRPWLKPTIKFVIEFDIEFDFGFNLCDGSEPA